MLVGSLGSDTIILVIGHHSQKVAKGPENVSSTFIGHVTLVVFILTNHISYAFICNFVKYKGISAIFSRICRIFRYGILTDNFRHEDVNVS